MKVFGWVLMLGLGVSVSLAAADDVRGTLVDKSGQPIAGAKLSSMLIQQRGAGNRPSVKDLTAVTGPDGTFTFKNLPSLPTQDIPMVLIAQLTNGSLAHFEQTSDGQTTTISESGRNLKLQAVDPHGQPLTGARATVNIYYFAKNSSQGDVYYGAQWHREVVANATGTIEYDGLPLDARVNYTVAKRGFISVNSAVAPGQLQSDVETIKMGQAAILKGRVLQGSKPVPGVTVFVETVIDHQGIRAGATTDSDGNFEISDAPTGSGTLGVDLGALGKDWVVKPYKDLRLSPGVELDGLNLELDKGILLTGRVLTVQKSLPVADARLMVLSGGVTRVDITTDKNGQFSARVPEGEQYVSVGEVKGRPTGQQGYVRATVTAQANPALEIRIADALLYSPIPRLGGTVVDATGKPVSDATVTDLQTKATAISDENGKFQFDKTSNPTDLIVATKGDEICGHAVEVSNSPSISLTLDARQGVIQGVVVGEDGTPISGVEVSLGGSVGSAFIGLPPVTTDSLGAYRFSGLYGGLANYFLWGKKDGFGQETIQPIDVASGETKTLTPMKLMLADGTIDGKVVEADGSPARLVTVTSQCPGTKDVLTDDNGEFHLTGVPRGSRYIAAGRNNSYSASAKASTGDTNVLIKMGPPQKEIPGLVEQNKTGHTAPELRVKEWVGGKPVDLKGKIVVIDFWAVWCHPCVEALPRVQALAARYGSKVVVLGIHAPGTPTDKIAAFVKAHGLTYRTGVDPDDGSGIGVNHRAFGPSGIPHVFVISPEGRILSDSNEIGDAEKVLASLLGSH